MKKHFLTWMSISLFACLALIGTACFGAEEKVKTDKAQGQAEKGETYLLRYKFKPGEEIRWDVFRHGRTQTTVSGTTQTSETITKSTKIWKIVEVHDDGSFVFENQTEDVDMWQKMAGCEEVHFNSKEKKKPPHGFETVVERIGKPLARITLDPRGNVKKRVDLVKKHKEDEKISPVTIPLPKEAVAVGHVWRIPHDVFVSLDNDLTKKVLIHQVFTLKKVQNDVATIDVDTQILTPINDPAIQVKLINQYMKNTVRFDVKRGRIISQQQDLDKKVIGFRGPDSRTHYLTRFTEKLKTLK
ncbi:MAG: hypothetical protein PVH19_00930 [Planctomycetia bacterium]